MIAIHEIRRLNEGDFEAFTRIVANAYPGFKLKSPEDFERQCAQLLKIHKQDADVNFYGCFRHSNLVGGMRLHDFTMQLLSQRVPAGGVGLVAVDLARKKEKICRDLILWYLRHYREQGVNLALLYPFRPDFYKQMGFGFGSKMHVYRIPPANLPAGSKEQVQFLGPEDRERLAACYSRVQKASNGLLDKSAWELSALFENPARRVIGCVQDGLVTGYAIFGFEAHSPQGFLWNDMIVTEFLWEDCHALAQLLAFMRSQADQVSRIVFHSQDDNFHHLFADPRYGVEQVIFPVGQQSNISAVGIMYRVLNVERLFAQLAGHNFNGVSCRLRLTVRDTLLPENDCSLVLDFQAGRLTPASGSAPVELALDITEFSSLVTGAVGLSSLWRLGRVHISDPHQLELLDQLFWARHKPWCLTPF